MPHRPLRLSHRNSARTYKNVVLYSPDPLSYCSVEGGSGDETREGLANSNERNQCTYLMEIKVVPYLLFCSLTSVIYCLPFFLWSTTQIIIWYQPNLCRCWEYEYTHKHWKQIESGGTIVYQKKWSRPLPHPSKVRIQCASARSISTRYNQPYA